jgi:hypothetical protein
MGSGQPDLFAGVFDLLTESVDLLAESLLAFAGRFEFVFDRRLLIGFEVDAVEFAGEFIDLTVADPAAERFGQPGSEP